MGSSLMLKDSNGRLTGYIQRVGDDLRCKIHRGEHSANAQITLLFADGQRQNREVPCDGSEVEWRLQGDLKGAYVLAGGSLVSATDDGARAAARLALAQAWTPVAEETPVAQPVQQETRACVYADLEPRWPHPPCRPYAHYEAGRWITPDERRNGERHDRDGT